MQSTSTTADIISKFQLYLDDGTELAEQDELDLADKIYRRICDQRPFLFLTKNATGTLTVSGTSAYLTVPSDFKYFSINDLTTDNAVGVDNNASPVVVYVGPNVTPYQVINYRDRRQYVNRTGVCYYDASMGRVVFPVTPVEATLAYDFDYIMEPPALDLVGSNPLFPARYWDAIYHGMAVDEQIIQLFDRAHSYQKENLDNYNMYVRDLVYWDSQFTLN